MESTSDAGTITVVPASKASWADLAAIFGERGDPSWCLCQWFKIRHKDWNSVPIREKAARLREQTRCGLPRSATTTGLVGYLDSEPAGWSAIEPRAGLVRLRTSRVVWAGRDEDPDDDGVWAVTCFVTRIGYRRRGIGGALAKAGVDFARERGARSVEGYPMVPAVARGPSAATLYVGTVDMFEQAGYREVSRPLPQRAVMRIDF
jgi:ribosomal protein S18 acetylase RimI-like enzyme